MAADRAFAMAGASRDAVDLVNPYDCYTITVLVTLENAGFCGKGEGGRFVEEHDLTFRGDFPLNTHGGQLGMGQAGLAGGPLARDRGGAPAPGAGRRSPAFEVRSRLRKRDRRDDGRAGRAHSRGRLSGNATRCRWTPPALGEPHDAAVLRGCARAPARPATLPPRRVLLLPAQPLPDAASAPTSAGKQ